MLLPVNCFRLLQILTLFISIHVLMFCYCNNARIEREGDGDWRLDREGERERAKKKERYCVVINGIGFRKNATVKG